MWGRVISSTDLKRRLLAECLGTALLTAGVVGSGIMATTLSDEPGIQLLINAAATAGVLVAVILAFGPVSGAHLNPVVTLAGRFFGGLSRRLAGGYVAAQTLGACVGAVVANLMFGLPAVELSTTERFSGPLWLAEVVATFGLLMVVFGLVRSDRASLAPFAVAAYIGGAYFFTASTSFANPAVTGGRILSDSFTGIAPSSAPMFVVAQLAGAAIAVIAVRYLFPDMPAEAESVVVPHDAGGQE